MKLKLSLVVDHRVPGVGAAAITDHCGDVSGKVVDDLPLAFVAPLTADYRIGRHAAPRKFTVSPSLKISRAKAKGQYSKIGLAWKGNSAR